MAMMMLREVDGTLQAMHPSWFGPQSALNMSRMPAKFSFKALAAAEGGRALVIADYPTAGQTLTIKGRNLAIDTTHRQALYSLYPVLVSGIQTTPDPNITPIPISPPVPWPQNYP